VEEERRERFEQIVPLVIEQLRRYLARRTDPATAEDALAETLLVCWRRLEDLPEDPLPYAYGVARRCLANAERGQRRQRRLARRIEAVDPPLEAAWGSPVDEVDERVAAALAALRPAEAELLRLWAWEDLSPAQIAAVLDITPNAASIRLHRARARVKQELGKIDRRGGHEQNGKEDRP